MFIGHFAMGFAATRLAPRLWLGDALLAAQLPDVIWPFLVLAGVERVVIAPGDTVVTPLRFESYPISHSLLMVAVWGTLLAVLYGRWRRSTGAGVAFGLLALSHWFLDFISHRPDMPLVPGASLRLGLGLWNSRPATLAVEGALFACGVWLYASRPGESRRGRVALGLLVATLAILYVGNMYGPLPPNVQAVAGSAIVLMPVVWLWANWVDGRFRGEA